MLSFILYINVAEFRKHMCMAYLKYDLDGWFSYVVGEKAHIPDDDARGSV